MSSGWIGPSETCTPTQDGARSPSPPCSFPSNPQAFYVWTQRQPGPMHCCRSLALSQPTPLTAAWAVLSGGRPPAATILRCPIAQSFSLVEKAMAPHSSTLAWEIPWMEEPGRLQSMGSLRVGHTEQLHFHFSLSCTGEGNGNPLQWSCLENPRHGEA